MAGSEGTRPRRRRSLDGLLAVVGYVLSPLSWWNDALVNIPLAYALATLVALATPKHFAAALVGGYWVTNILGLFLLHRGVVGLTCRTPPCSYTSRMLLKDLGISLLYTLAVGLLAWAGILAPPSALSRG